MIQIRYPPQTSFFEIFHAKTGLRYSRRKQDGWSVLLTLAKKVLLRASTPHFGKQGIVHRGTVW